MLATDGQGTVAESLDTSGAVTSTQLFTPYGVFRFRIGSSTYGSWLHKSGADCAHCSAIAATAGLAARQGMPPARVSAVGHIASVRISMTLLMCIVAGMAIEEVPTRASGGGWLV